MWWTPEHPHFAHRGAISFSVEREFPDDPSRNQDTHLQVTVEARRDDGLHCRIRVLCCTVRDLLSPLLHRSDDAYLRLGLGIDELSLDIDGRFDPRFGLMLGIGTIRLGLGGLDNQALVSTRGEPFLLDLVSRMASTSKVGMSFEESNVRKYAGAIQFLKVPEGDSPHLSIEAHWWDVGFWVEPGSFIEAISGFFRQSYDLLGDVQVEGASLTQQSRAAIESLERMFSSYRPAPNEGGP